MKNLSMSEIKTGILFFSIILYLSPLFSVWILASNPEVIANQFLLDPYKDVFSFTFWELIIGLPILYYCAFKKHGTRWLTFSIWCVAPFLLMWTPVLIIYIGCILGLNFDSFRHVFFEVLSSRICVVGNEDNWVSFFITKIICEILTFIVAIFMLRCEISLLKRNNISQYKETLKSNTYKQAYDLIDSATDHKQLQAIYCQLVCICPEINKFLKFKNNKKKQSLKIYPKNRGALSI